jgi:excinuclease UvrABC ATPase subunit
MTELIEIRGAREKNVKDILLRIRKREITIFTGVFAFESGDVHGCRCESV